MLRVAAYDTIGKTAANITKYSLIGELAAFLSCYESSYITGAQIVIDGGSTLPETFTMGV